MTTVIPFPIIARPIPRASSPRAQAYQRGVEDSVTAILRTLRGMPEADARAEARQITERSFTDMPDHAGEGEV